MVPLKVNIFGSQLLLNRIPTKDNYSEEESINIMIFGVQVGVTWMKMLTICSFDVVFMEVFGL